MNATAFPLLLNELFGLSMPFSHIAGYAAAGLGLVAGMSHWKELRRNAIFLMLAVFIAYGLTRNIFTSHAATGYQVMAGYLMHWLAPFVLGWSLADAGQIKRSASVYYLAFAVLAFLSVLAYFGLFFKSPAPHFVLADEGLLKGGRHHIAMGALCLTASFMSLSQALRHDKSLRARAVFCAANVFFLISLLLTGSRGYYIAALFSYSLFGIHWLARTRRWKVMVAAVFTAVIVAGALYLAVPGIRGRVHRTNSKDGNITERFAMYRVALAEIGARPAFGFGPGQAALQTEYYALLPPEMRGVQRHHHLHSLYLHLGADFGLAGLLLFLAIAGLILRDGARLLSSGDNFVQSLGTAVFFSVTGILAGDCFDTLMRGPGVAMEVFWLAGMASAALRHQRKDLPE